MTESKTSITAFESATTRLQEQLCGEVAIKMMLEGGFQRLDRHAIFTPNICVIYCVDIVN